jgi:hypothetical protein
MIQFNLLPDIKQEFVKVNRTKRTVIVVCVLVSTLLLVVFILLLSWDGLQKKNLRDINNDISTNRSQLTSTANLSKVLTIQNQLSSLPVLEKQNPVASRLFGYLSQITPTTATISTLNVDFTAHTVEITGNADTLATVNVFADTLKFTTYSLPGQATSTASAFSSVVLSSFAVNNTGVTYTLDFSYDPTLFSSSTNTGLTVPTEITTRSDIDQPTDLFQTTRSTTNGS